MLFGFIGRLPRGALPACFVAFVLALGAGPSQAQNAVPVEVTTAESGAVRDEIEVVGNIRADESVIIRPEISGLVKDVHFSEGDTVEADDLLFSLDDEILSAEVTEAEAAHELAKRNYERSTKLLSRQVGTERTRDEALAEMQSSEAKLSLAKARLNKTKIRAPFSGIIGFREISVGAYVSTGTDLVRLVKTDPVEVAFRVPERFLPVLGEGQDITVRVDAFPDREFSGEVFALDNIVDINGRSIQVRARVPNPDLLLRPGLFARVNLVTELRQDAVIVPEAAIVPTVDGAYVLRVVDGKAKRTDVTIGRRMAGEVEIVDGLSAGETVIVAGQQKARDGAPVQPLDSAEGA
jgi:membrane fusion protein (multidrug efflux system)